MADAAQLAAAQGAVAVFVHETMGNKFDMPGGRVTDAAGLPAAVRDAHAFYYGILCPPGDCFGELFLFELPAALGSAVVVVAARTEQWSGAVEIYSARGEFWAAGVYMAGLVVWVDVPTARAAIDNEGNPQALMPNPDPLTWYSMGPEAAVSAGGRFFISPPAYPGTNGPTRFQISDYRSQTHPEADTFAEAKAIAAERNAQG